MNPQKNQGTEDSTLLADLQSEVSTETAPLLQFMLRHAGIIAAVVVAFVLVLAGTAGWRWYGGKQTQEARAELARVGMSASGPERTKALKALAERTPAATRLYANLALGQSALADADYATAAEAYATAAKLDGEGPLGAAAAWGQAGVLLQAGKNAEALALLQALEQRFQAMAPKGQEARAQSTQFRQMLAEAATKTGQKDLAAATYRALAKDVQGLDREYFLSRADELVGPVPTAPAAEKSPDAAATPR